MRRLLTLLILLLGGSGVAWGQSMTPLGPAACLRLEGAGPAQPVYPDEALRLKEGGTVPVELTFTARDRKPDVKWLDDNYGRAIKNAVEDHVARLRLPCMPSPSAPVVLRQEYVFVPNDGRKVVSSGPEDVAEADRMSRLACLTHVNGDKRPEYPDRALQQSLQETLLVELRFERPDRAPAMTVLAPRGQAQMEGAVKAFVRGLRLPCLGADPIVTRALYKFQIDGGARMTLKDTDLKTLLKAARDVPVPVFFDLNTMSCPFDLRLTYQQPFARNGVDELEAAVPARKPFVEWLRDLRLAFNEQQALRVLGDTMTITVPCGKVDL